MFSRLSFSYGGFPPPSIRQMGNSCAAATSLLFEIGDFQEHIEMSVELVRLCDPDAHYDKFLAAGIYPDGRGIEIFSAISLKVIHFLVFSMCFLQIEQYGGIGSSIVRQGGVTASCTVSGELCLVNDGPLIIPKVEGTSDLSEVSWNSTYVTDFRIPLMTFWRC